MLPDYYEFACTVKIVSGLKALTNLPYEMDLLGMRRALLVTDPGVAGAGLIKQVEKVFDGASCEIGAVYDKTPPDSSTRIAGEAAAAYTDGGCDGFIAVGGGSAMDTAKAANMMVTLGVDDLHALEGAERVKERLKPFIAIPTTAGTGSEVTLVAVIRDEERDAKLAFTSLKTMPDVAILDPKMTLTLPPMITAATAMDALTHAIEAYHCLQKNPVSDAFAVAAIQLLMANAVTCVEDGKDPMARLALANAALLAGMSFSNSMVGVVHGLAHATGGVAHVPHGVANGILLPWGMEYNLDKAGAALAGLAPVLGASASGSEADQARAAIQAVRDLQQRFNKLCGLPCRLRDAGVEEGQLEAIAETTVNDGTVVYNPTEVTRDAALEVLKKAF